MQPLSWGLVGAGHIAESAIEQLRAVAGVRVNAVCSRPSPRRDDFCQRFQVAQATSELDDLLALPLDAVFIATPNKFHADYAARALSAGKHVLLDKPFARSLSEALLVFEALQRLEEKHTTATTLQPQFALGMNLRFTQEAARLRYAVQSGALGRITHVRASWLRHAGIPQLGSWFGNQELAGGGVLLDLGVHVLDLVSYVLDDFAYANATAVTHSLYGARGLGQGGWGRAHQSNLTFDVEDSASALLRLSSGVSLQLDLAWAGPYPDDQLEITVYGEKGALPLHAADIVPAPGEQPRQLTPVPPLAENRFAHFCACIRGQAAGLVTLHQALCVQAALDAIYQSAADGCQAQVRALPQATYD